MTNLSQALHDVDIRGAREADLSGMRTKFREGAGIGVIADANYRPEERSRGVFLCLGAGLKIG